MPSSLLWKPYGGFSLADLSPSGFKAVASDPAYIAADCFSIPPLHTVPTSCGILLHPAAQVLVSELSAFAFVSEACAACALPCSCWFSFRFAVYLARVFSKVRTLGHSFVCWLRSYFIHLSILVCGAIAVSASWTSGVVSGGRSVHAPGRRAV